MFLEPLRDSWLCMELAAGLCASGCGTRAGCEPELVVGLELVVVPELVVDPRLVVGPGLWLWGQG